MFKIGGNSELFTSREIVRATSVPLCTPERSGYLACTSSPLESAPYFTDILCSALVCVGELDGVEDAPLHYASLRT